MKFGAFMELAGHGFDAVATGHYAQVRPGDRPGAPGSRARLFAAVDPVKDQTYFLSRLAHAQLERALFPIGHLIKPEVRALARELDLETQSRKDSQGICFLGEISYPEFVREHLGSAPGDIVDASDGRVLGRHQGLWFHTIGQRKGLGLPGGPWFVVEKDVPSRRLLVAHADRLPAHQRGDFEVEALHWLAEPPAPDDRLELKLRHGPRRIACHLGAGSAPGLASVRLETPDPGIAPGQFAVFYRAAGDGAVECLGSGVIR
jgi:tRNA-specific 2-thiouridylase